VAKKALAIDGKIIRLENKVDETNTYYEFQYDHSNGEKCLIKINPECKCLDCCRCDFITFQNKGICFHFIACFIYLNIEIPGLVLNKKIQHSHLS